MSIAFVIRTLKANVSCQYINLDTFQSYFKKKRTESNTILLNVLLNITFSYRVLYLILFK